MSNGDGLGESFDDVDSGTGFVSAAGVDESRLPMANPSIAATVKLATTAITVCRFIGMPPRRSLLPSRVGAELVLQVAHRSEPPFGIVRLGCHEAGYLWVGEYVETLFCGIYDHIISELRGADGHICDKIGEAFSDLSDHAEHWVSTNWGLRHKAVMPHGHS